MATTTSSVIRTWSRRRPGASIWAERRLGRRGVFGVNVFYRDITDLIEITNTGEASEDEPDAFVLTAENIGDGQVWGIEFDLSTPLDFIGMPNTGVS